MYADANRSVLSRDLKAPIVSADLVDGDREFQTVGAAIDKRPVSERTDEWRMMQLVGG